MVRRAPDAATEARVARRARLSTVALICIVLGISAFAVWSSQATAKLTAQAASVATLSDAYANAAKAVAEEELLERKYRLEPSPAVQALYGADADQLRAALTSVTFDGKPADRKLAGQVLAQHTAYFVATGQMFRAVDRGDTVTILRIDNDQDPAFASIEKTVDGAAAAHHQQS